MHRAILLLFAIMAAAEVHACSCGGPVSVEFAFQHADAIFAGVVVSIDNPRDRAREMSEHNARAAARIPPHLDPDWGRKVTFRVMQWWKTEAFAESVETRTGYGGGDCGYPVEVGKSYLVYASRDLHGVLAFGICGRTAALLCASGDIPELGEPIKTYEEFDVPSLLEREQPYTTYWRPCIKPPVLTGDRGLEMDKHCRFNVNGVIGTDGSVHDFKIISRSFPERCPASLDKQVRERVAQWRFLPAEFESKPIETLLTSVSWSEPINETEYAKQLKDQAEWQAKRKAMEKPPG